MSSMKPKEIDIQAIRDSFAFEVNQEGESLKCCMIIFFE